MSEVFLDTSIIISRQLHGDDVRSCIEKRLSGYNLVLTSLTVLQEYKRRVLEEAKYLLNQLNTLGSVKRVQRHVMNVLPPQQRRKQTICLAMLTTFFDTADDSDQTERATLYLRSLLLFGMSTLEESVDSIIRDSKCACASTPIIEKKTCKQYDFGTDKCSNLRGKCGIVKFLQDRSPELITLKNQILTIPEEKRTSELNKILNFINSVLTNFETAPDHNPCLKVGDLLIALESKNIADFYTLNFKESLHLCKALKQNLIIGHLNTKRPEQVLRKEDPVWNIID